RRRGSCAADLESGTGGRLAWPLGHELDADQRVDAQAQACGAAARGRSAGHCWRRHLEVSGLAPVRGTVGRAAGRVDGAAKTDRPELAKVIRRLESGDVLVVTRLDRLARSTRDLLNVLDEIGKRGAGFKSLKDTWADTTTPHGRLMLTVLGGLAEFERELIRARTGEGRIRAKARGVKFGRPRKLTPHQRQEALQRLQAGETMADVARTYAVDPATISRLAASSPFEDSAVGL